MKRLHATRLHSLLRCLGEVASDEIKVRATAGLAVVIPLPESASDVDIASRALQLGLAPARLSPWYMQSSRQRGLLLGVTNLNERRLAADFTVQRKPKSHAPQCAHQFAGPMAATSTDAN